MATNTFHFLQGGGETGQLIRSFDWTTVGMGTTDTWPTPLKNVVRLMLDSPIPTSVFWGSEFTHLYNDASISVLGTTRHPSSLGASMKLISQAWNFIGPLFEKVMLGETVHLKEHLFVLDRNGYPEDCFMDVSYIPIYIEDGTVGGIQGMIVDKTDRIRAIRNLQTSEEKFRTLIEEAPVATCFWSGNNQVLEVVNDIMLGYWGKDRSVIGKPVAEGLPELEGQGFLELLSNIFITGETHSEKAAKVNLEKDGKLSSFYFDFTYKPLLNSKGEVYGIMNMAIDVTEQVLAQEKLQRSQEELLAYFNESPVGIAIISKENLTFRMANPFYGVLVGRKPEELIDKPLLEALPELRGQGFDRLLNNVIDSGIAYIAKEVQAELVRSDGLETIYVDLAYQPRKEEGIITGVLVVATDVTRQVLDRQKVERSESKLRSIISAAPAGIGLFVGRDLVIEYPNQTFIDIVGKGPGIDGLPLREAMPELITEGQPFLQILDDVYTTGKMFQSFGSQVKIVQNGVLTDNYYNITYTPVFDSKGNVFAILDIAVDVTDQIKAQQKLEQAEAELRGAIEVAGLATWSLNIEANTYRYSPRFMDWLGFSEDTKGLDDAYNPLPEEIRQQVIAAVQAAIAPGSSGVYDNEHAIINRLTGETRIIHAQAQTFYDATGAAIELRGTAHDITMQRQLQLALENEVSLRTEELASINEEMQATNEELEEANTQLTHSNAELAQYAYVASHDLQEPLRKIRIFSDMLKDKGNLDDESKAIAIKISSSAERMSLLIHGLLEFSRLLKADSLMRPVDLGEIIKAVADDFELTIKEKEAIIAFGPLPVIEAVALQMNQLFYNLISNALKFTKPNVAPYIKIASVALSVDEAKIYIEEPMPFCTHYHITVTDNGIGFDTEYSEQIFEVFKRLHGREQYPGSGIGLALCRRIAGNHNGILYAESEQGKGTTFHLVIPDKYQNFIPGIPNDFQWKND